MKLNGKILSVLTLLLSMTAAGCYTQLMTPQEFTKVRREKPIVRPDVSFSLNYNQSCVSCHSRAELDDRYYDLKYYGITSVHGIPLDPIAWSGSDYYYSPFEEIYFAPQPGIITPWWLPPAVTVTGQNTPVNSGERIRVTGATRDGGREREPVQATPSSTSTGTSASTPPPATSAAPSSTQTQPASSGSERTRSDDSSNSGSRTRTDGSTRDDTNRPR